MRTRVTVELRDGRTLERTQDDYDGYHTRPMSWEAVIAKFERLASPATSRQRRDSIVTAVRSLETINVSDLTELLAG